MGNKICEVCFYSAWTPTPEGERCDYCWVAENFAEFRVKFNNLLSAITEHHAQKADDLCWKDDDRLYAAAGLPPRDNRINSEEEQLAQCQRFIKNRCQGGGNWKSYVDLESKLAIAMSDCADAASLRLAFNQLVEGFYKQHNNPITDKKSQRWHDVKSYDEIVVILNHMYQTVINHTAGLALLAELANLKQQLKEKEHGTS